MSEFRQKNAIVLWEGKSIIMCRSLFIIYVVERKNQNIWLLCKLSFVGFHLYFEKRLEILHKEISFIIKKIK